MRKTVRKRVRKRVRSGKGQRLIGITFILFFKVYSRALTVTDPNYDSLICSLLDVSSDTIQSSDTI